MRARSWVGVALFAAVVGAVAVPAGIGSAAPKPTPPLTHPLVKVVSNKPLSDAAVAATTWWTPKNMAAAYGLTYSRKAGSGYTIAIIDAYDAPHIQRDLNKFTKNMRLPRCTTANKCFTKVNQRGAATPLPPTNPSWALEIALDVEWAHAMAPGAKIVLVEADDASYESLTAAVDYANKNIRATHVFISNSYASEEWPGESDFDQHYTPQAGHSILVASGDSGLPAGYPSSAPNVVSVGGTVLNQNGVAVTETVWTGGGGGCSAYEPAAGPQQSFKQYGQTGCRIGGISYRATPDLEADAGSPVPVFTTDFTGRAEWWGVGGTSLASPLMAGIGAARHTPLNAEAIYQGTFKFRDVNAGPGGATNGAVCHTGFDLCTGRGALIGQ